MTLELGRFNVMEHLWETLDKTEDGQHIRYHRIDLEQLWWMGFVDTQAYPMEEWLSAFEPYKQPDGSYLLNRDQFLALDRYRYKGEIKIPFDPMLINEGRYTDEGLDELTEASIVPSCSLPRDKVFEFMAQIKKDFRQPDGLILIQRPAKERIRALLEEHSSPLRNLEILLDQMLEQKGKELVGEIERAEADAATAQAAIQVSRFASQPLSKAEESHRGLEAIEKARKRLAHAEAVGVEKVEIKKIRRSRKGMRG